MFRMWNNDEISQMIRLIEYQVLRDIPIVPSNNNHEFTGNILEIARDWEQIANSINRSVIDCKKQWRLLVRQFLFTTNRVFNIDDDDDDDDDDDENEYRYTALYPINWRYVEQMMFLVPYTGKYERRDLPEHEDDDDNDKDDAEDEQPTKNIQTNIISDGYEFGTMTPPRLKAYIKDKLRTKDIQLVVRELQYNFKHLCVGRPYLNKFTYMIELNVEAYRQHDRMRFLNWYGKQLDKIIFRQRQQNYEQRQQLRQQHRQQQQQQQQQPQPNS